MSRNGGGSIERWPPHVWPSSERNLRRSCWTRVWPAASSASSAWPIPSRRCGTADSMPSWRSQRILPRACRPAAGRSPSSSMRVRPGRWRPGNASRTPWPATRRDSPNSASSPMGSAVPISPRSSAPLAAGPGLGLRVGATLLAAFLGGAQRARSLRARGIREAQQDCTPLYLVITLPAMAAPFLEGWDRSGWTYVAPGLGPMFAIRGLLLGDLPPTLLTATLGSTALFAGVSLLLAVRSLRHDPESPATAGP